MVEKRLCLEASSELVYVVSALGWSLDVSPRTSLAVTCKHNTRAEIRGGGGN